MPVFHGDKNLVLGDVISQWDHDLHKYVLNLEGKVASEFRKVCGEYTYTAASSEPADPAEDGK